MKISDLDFLKDISVNETFISLDTDGNMAIEGYKKLLDYKNDKIQIIANSKMLYIYGSELIISSCTKHTAILNGKISKIEIYEVNNV